MGLIIACLILSVIFMTRIVLTKEFELKNVAMLVLWILVFTGNIIKLIIRTGG